MAHHLALGHVDGQNSGGSSHKTPTVLPMMCSTASHCPTSLGAPGRSATSIRVQGADRSSVHAATASTGSRFTDQEYPARHDAGATDFGDRGIHDAPGLPDRPYARSATGLGGRQGGLRRHTLRA